MDVLICTSLARTHMHKSVADKILFNLMTICLKIS